MNKNQLKKLKETLLKKNRLVFDTLSQKQRDQMVTFNNAYKQFLNKSKTEREAAEQIVAAAEKKGFVDIDSFSGKTTAKPGQKVYKVFHNRCVGLAVLGKEDPSGGSHIIASHIDSPRLDLKQNPFYEDLDMGLIKTHYYGGIRKYHWLAIPLALHGTVITGTNEKTDITIGEDPDDPVFTITDLLPHLAGKTEGDKKLPDVFVGEKLNLLAGSAPMGEETDKDRFKLHLLHLIHEKYGLTEEDFVSAEIEAVPAEKARDVGLDRSMIGAYGQDDRVCAYTGLQALLDAESPQKTAMALFFDKEEIGSEGSSGAKSNFLEDFMSDLLMVSGQTTDNRCLRKALINSRCLSADVNAAMDPDYKEVHEPMNAARLGYGICITKFTGVRGKSGSNDASAEFVGKIRHIFNKNKIVWQTGELGKIDEGGGGTVAKFLAEFGMNVLDCGPAILSMHSPFEVSSKADVYMTYLGYKAFYEDTAD
ncbi:MAG: aminopeptidase [Desulfobacterales bacterium]|nr:aminopeptidase [Desulfobacterales bacterium]